MKKDDEDLVEIDIDGHKHLFVKQSLFIFGPESNFRLFLIRLTQSERFSNFIMLTILLNSISIAMFDNSLAKTSLNNVMQILSYVFCMIYTMEAAMRIIAEGFCIGSNTYLRNPANVFDFIIVIISIHEFVFQVFASDKKQLLTVFRVLKVFRVARLLSSFYKIDALRQQLRTLGGSFVGLLNVLVFLGIFFALFAVIGLQLFGDSLYNACRITPEPVESEHGRFWERAPVDGLSPGGICTKTKGNFGGFHCPADFTCGNNLDFGLPIEDEV